MKKNPFFCDTWPMVHTNFLVTIKTNFLNMLWSEVSTPFMCERAWRKDWRKIVEGRIVLEHTATWRAARLRVGISQQSCRIIIWWHTYPIHGIKYNSFMDSIITMTTIGLLPTICPGGSTSTFKFEGRSESRGYESELGAALCHCWPPVRGSVSSDRSTRQRGELGFWAISGNSFEKVLFYCHKN